MGRGKSEPPGQRIRRTKPLTITLEVTLTRPDDRITAQNVITVIQATLDQTYQAEHRCDHVIVIGHETE